MSVSAGSEHPYVLGLDLGSASLGWALIGIDAIETPVSLIRAGVRIFEPGVDGSALDIQQGKDQSKAVDPGSRHRLRTTASNSERSRHGPYGSLSNRRRQSNF